MVLGSKETAAAFVSSLTMRSLRAITFYGKPRLLGFSFLAEIQFMCQLTLNKEQPLGTQVSR